MTGFKRRGPAAGWCAAGFGASAVGVLIRAMATWTQRRVRTNNGPGRRLGLASLPAIGDARVWLVKALQV
jgi:hypothetical protein